MGAWTQPFTVPEIVANTRAVRWWIDEQIERGKTDEEIAAALPLAVEVITGRLPLWSLRARLEAMSG